MIDSVREVEMALGKMEYKLTIKERNGRWLLRFLFVVEDVKKGEIFNEHNVCYTRPGYGFILNIWEWL